MDVQILTMMNFLPPWRPIHVKRGNLSMMDDAHLNSSLLVPIFDLCWNEHACSLFAFHVIEIHTRNVQIIMACYLN